MEVYKADFGNDIAAHFTGEFRLTQTTPRLIIASTENSKYGRQVFRNQFSCQGRRAVAGIALPEISKVTTSQGFDDAALTPVGTARFVLKSLSDKPLPEENFRIKLPPGSRLADPTTGNVWRIGPNGSAVFERNDATK